MKAAQTLAASLLASILLAGSALAAETVQVRETALGNGMRSGGLKLPVQSSSANFWSGFQTIEVKSGASTNSFQAFCVDPFQWSSDTFSTYNVYTQSDVTTVLGASKAAEISTLYNHAYAGTLSGANANLNAAAMQLALWEIVNDTKNLATGSVQTVSGTNAGLKTATQSLLDAQSTPAGAAQYAFTLYTSSSKQDFLVATPVPEPETWAMMLAGLGLLGLAARRRKAS